MLIFMSVLITLTVPFYRRALDLLRRSNR